MNIKKEIKHEIVTLVLDVGNVHTVYWQCDANRVTKAGMSSTPVITLAHLPLTP